MTFDYNTMSLLRGEDPLENAFNRGDLLGVGNLSLQTQKVAPAVQAAKSGVDAGTVAGAAATPFMATPGGAAVLIGSQIAMQMAAQNAAANQAKRQRDMEIAQNKGAGEERGFQTIMEGLRSALR